MVFWQLTINANDPARLARFWAVALGYQPVPPTTPETTWNAHYRARASYEDRIFDPDGLRPPIWFQSVPETKAGPNRLHLDLYPTGRDASLTFARRVEIVEAKVAELVGAGAEVGQRVADESEGDYWVVMHDPEGNEFCVS